MHTDAYVATRVALHGVAELLLAGPQHAESGQIRLRVVPGGFATTSSPDVAVLGADIVRGSTRIELAGKSLRELADELGVELHSLADVYRDVTSADPDEPLAVDAAAAHSVCNAYAIGDAALRAFAPDADPVLWPEHFDVAITVDEVNYGVTPGDSGIETAYMYVGPHSLPERDDFWNEPFGAAKPLSSRVEDVVSFFQQGRDRLVDQTRRP